MKKKKRRKITIKKEEIKKISIKNEADAAIINNILYLNIPDPEFHKDAPLKYYIIRSYVSAIIELYQI